MITSSWVSRILLAATSALGIATANGIIKPIYAGYATIAMAFLQSLQHPVTQSTQDNVIASSAVKTNATIEKLSGGN